MARFKLQGVKPLSVNDCWQGRRFMTKEYKVWRESVVFLLPAMVMPVPPFLLKLEFGFSSIASDIDNPIKTILDSLAERYRFNDKLIHRLVVDRVQVKRGEEYITFEIKTLINTSHPQIPMEM